MEQIFNQLNSLIKVVGATLVVARTGPAGCLDSGTGQARPLRPLFPARPRPGPRGGQVGVAGPEAARRKRRVPAHSECEAPGPALGRPNDPIVASIARSKEDYPCPTSFLPLQSYRRWSPPPP